MARYRCRRCRGKGQFAYEGIHACPICGSNDVQFALAIDELADDDPLIVALTKLAEEGIED
jgi:rRNA maturation endonuclease Nob1